MGLDWAAVDKPPVGMGSGSQAGVDGKLPHKPRAPRVALNGNSNSQSSGFVSKIRVVRSWSVGIGPGININRGDAQVAVRGDGDPGRDGLALDQP